MKLGSLCLEDLVLADLWALITVLRQKVMAENNKSKGEAST